MVCVLAITTLMILLKHTNVNGRCVMIQLEKANSKQQIYFNSMPIRMNSSF